MDTFDIGRIYFYRSKVGTFVIRFIEKENKWLLLIENEGCGLYDTPVAAADDVYCQATGYYEWDSIDANYLANNAPTDIYQWDIMQENK